MFLWSVWICVWLAGGASLSTSSTAKSLALGTVCLFPGSGPRPDLPNSMDPVLTKGQPHPHFLSLGKLECGPPLPSVAKCRGSPTLNSRLKSPAKWNSVVSCTGPGTSSMGPGTVPLFHRQAAT
eukprot:10847976-Heterocapsa_arctica.AAC.1